MSLSIRDTSIYALWRNYEYYNQIIDRASNGLIGNPAPGRHTLVYSYTRTSLFAPAHFLH